MKLDELKNGPWRKWQGIGTMEEDCKYYKVAIGWATPFQTCKRYWKHEHETYRECDDYKRKWWKRA